MVRYGHLLDVPDYQWPHLHSACFVSTTPDRLLIRARRAVGIRIGVGSSARCMSKPSPRIFLSCTRSDPNFAITMRAELIGAGLAARHDLKDLAVG